MSGKVALFVTCLVDVYRPSIAFAAVKLLRSCGYDVEVPLRQTCCGQPNYNSGDRSSAEAMARHTVDVFADFDYIVTVSGSCAGMLKTHYPLLFKDRSISPPGAELFPGKVFELSVFLTEVTSLQVPMRLKASVTYHDGCSGLRELGIKNQPRELLGRVDGLEIREMRDAEVCCGFGGAFSVKYPAISGAIVDKKVTCAIDANVDRLVAGDLGCILNMEGRLNRLGHSLPVYHYAELLADSIVDEAGL